MDEAEIIQRGDNQSVRLPRQYKFKGSKVFVKRVGNSVLLIPEENPWQDLLDSLDQFSPDFLAERNQPKVDDERETLE
jgi:antitoxin VapB